MNYIHVPCVMEYVKEFITLLESMSIRIGEDEDFVFIVHNTLKKVNIFFQELLAKGNYMMNFGAKTRWVSTLTQCYDVSLHIIQLSLITNLFQLWAQVPRIANQTFL